MGSRHLRCLVTMLAMAMLALLGCGGDTTTPPPEALDIEGGWTYLGPSDGPHDLTVGQAAMVYTDVAGQWSSNWTIKAVDNGLHHFQVAFASGSGTYLPVGQSMSGTYELSNTLLTVQLANGLASYPPLESPGSCTRATDGTPIPDCRTYIKKN
jgi:hypothetical protein